MSEPGHRLPAKVPFLPSALQRNQDDLGVGGSVCLGLSCPPDTLMLFLVAG